MCTIPTPLTIRIVIVRRIDRAMSDDVAQQRIFKRFYTIIKYIVYFIIYYATSSHGPNTRVCVQRVYDGPWCDLSV